jgi:hypothetical protein
MKRLSRKRKWVTFKVLVSGEIMLLQEKTFEVFADYHQFYLWDKGKSPLAPVDYSDDDVKRRIKAARHVIVIQPERAMTVPVTLEIHDSDPGFASDAWDHIAEASLHLPTGELQVHECTGGPVADFKVSSGWYRVRSHHGGFDTIADVGSDGADYYLITLWNAPRSAVKVLKQFPDDLRG